MALAESAHHTSRGQKTARAGVWGHGLNYTATIRNPPTHTHTSRSSSASTKQSPAGRGQTGLLPLYAPHERDLRRTVQQIVDTVPLVPLLDDPVPMLPCCFCRLCTGSRRRKFTFQLVVVVELVEVFPVFFQDRILQRCGPEPWTFLLLEVFEVFNVDRVQQRFWSRSPCPQIQVEVFKIFNQSKVPYRLLRFLLDTLVKGFYALFYTGKKCEDPAHPGVGTGCRVEPMDAVSLAGVW